METLGVILLLCGITIQDVKSLSLRIHPEHHDKGTGAAKVLITCLSNETLTHCQFCWRDINNSNGPLLDFSKGPSSPSNGENSYQGTGLNDGQCGISLNLPPGILQRVVGCRIRSKTSNWHYAHMTIFAHSKSATGLTLTPREIITRPGENVTLTCKKTINPLPLTGCRFRFPDGTSPNFNSGSSSLCTNSYCYYGSGLASGDCGVRLTSITEAMNGFVWCQGTTSSSDEWKASALIVSNPPSAPILQVKAENFSKNTILEASCTAYGILPTAKISWLWGGQLVTKDHENDPDSEIWRWPFEKQTIKQTFTRKLISTDNGTDLECRIEQVNDLPSIGSKYRVNFVREPSSPSGIELTLSSLKFRVGDSISAKCSVVGGYPKPEIKFYLGSNNLSVETVETRKDEIVVTVTKKLQIEDDGKELKCVAQNLAVPEPMEQRKMVNIEYPPQVSSKSMEQILFQVGRPGVAFVEVVANPKPNITWTVDTLTIEEGAIDVTERFEAAFLVQKNNDSNKWVAQLFIKNVTLEDLHSSFFLNARNVFGGGYFRAVNFEVAEQSDVAPAPILTLKPNDTHIKENSILIATCTVSSTRAVAIIGWTFNQATLTKGVGNAVLSKTDPQGTHTIARSVTLQPKQEDDGKALSCVVGDSQAEHIISVMYSPREKSSIILQYGLEIGKLGVLSVEISANPRPELSWEINGLVITEGHVEGRFHAPEALAKTRGKWEAKLYITRITPEDLWSTFLLTARNDAGATTYHISISTSQPQESSSENPSSEYFSTTDQTADDKYWFETTFASGNQFPSANSSTSKSAMFGSTIKEENPIMVHGQKYLQYLTIVNAVAILLLGLIIIMVYVRILRRLSLESKDSGRLPICIKNIYQEKPCSGGENLLMDSTTDIPTAESLDAANNENPIVTLMPDSESALVTFQQQQELPAWEANF